MDSAPTLIAEQLVRDVWNPSFPYNEKVHEDTVALLAHSLGTGLLHYYNRILSRYVRICCLILPRHEIVHFKKCGTRSRQATCAFKEYCKFKHSISIDFHLKIIDLLKSQNKTIKTQISINHFF